MGRRYRYLTRWRRKRETYREKYDKEHPKVTIRLDRESFEILEQACSVLNIDRSTFIRELLKGNFVNELIRLKESENIFKTCREELEFIKKENQELKTRVEELKKKLERAEKLIEEYKEKLEATEYRLKFLQRMLNDLRNKSSMYEKLIKQFEKLTIKLIHYLKPIEYSVEVGLIRKEVRQYMTPYIIAKTLHQVENYIKKDALILVLGEVQEKVVPEVEKLIRIFHELKARVEQGVQDVQ